MKWNIIGYMGKPKSSKKCAFIDKMKRGLKTFTGIKQGSESHSNANMGFFFFFLMEKEDDLEDRAAEKNRIENHIQRTGSFSRSILCP